MVHSLWGLFVGKLLLFYMKKGRDRRLFCSSCALDYNLNLMNSSDTVVNYIIKFLDEFVRNGGGYNIKSKSS